MLPIIHLNRTNKKPESKKNESEQSIDSIGSKQKPISIEAPASGGTTLNIGTPFTLKLATESTVRNSEGEVTSTAA